jgi:hypothetical protein
VSRCADALNAEETAYFNDEQVDLLERAPAPNEKALQAVLERENDAIKNHVTDGFHRRERFREIARAA